MFENLGHSQSSPIAFTSIEAQQQVYWNPLEGADTMVKLYYLFLYQKNKTLSKNDFEIKEKMYIYLSFHSVLSMLSSKTKIKI